jgi:hypothetical protein
MLHAGVVICIDRIHLELQEQLFVISILHSHASPVLLCDP